MLTNKVAIITGGARGIGREIALSFINHGASIYYIDVHPGDSEDEYRRLAEKHGGFAKFRKGDITDEEGINAVNKEILAENDSIDILVNNAGITRDNLMFRMSAKEWLDVISINLTGAFYMSKPIARSMVRKRKGSIINIASIVGIIGNGGQTNYSASKAGLIGFTKSLAREIALKNVRVNAVAPGFIHTHMTEQLTEEQKNALKSAIPMGRIGTAEEVAKAALFLASDLSSYLTGQVLQVTGGLGM